MYLLFVISNWSLCSIMGGEGRIGEISTGVAYALSPYLISACKSALGMAFKSGIAAEVIGVPDFSIGANLYEAKIYLDTASLFAWTLAIILIASCFEKILLRLMTAAGGKGNTVHEKQ